MRHACVLPAACLLAMATPVRAEGPVIDHAGVACMVAEKFPRLEARIVEPEAISRARVQFRGEGGPWYFVEMKPSGALFTGVLPRPKSSLMAIHYYIEATDRQFRVNRTPEFAASVVPPDGVCAGGKMMAAVASSASVLVGSPAGAAAVPAGFSSAGVTSATASSAAGAGAAAASGGRLGTAATLGIIAGGAAVAGVAVAAHSSGGGDSKTPASAPSGGPAPTTVPSGSAGTSYTGPFSGQRLVTGIAAPGGCQSTTSSFVGTIKITLQSAGATAADTAEAIGTSTVLSNSGTCTAAGNQPGDAVPISWHVPVTGSAGALAFSGSVDSGGITESIAFSGALNGGVVSGTVTFAVSGLGRSGTTSIPVTLR